MGTKQELKLLPIMTEPTLLEISAAEARSLVLSLQGLSDPPGRRIGVDGVYDLIERMGTITKQLKSYARKGGDDFVPVDMAEALASALSMMEPQLRQRKVKINRIIPDAAHISKWPSQSCSLMEPSNS